MSHTNSTPNFNLPQFVGTDKPAWLTDINGAFSAIDTAIKNASDTATTASTNATTANKNIGTLSDLTTTAKTNVVSAVNEVNSNVGTAQNTANEAYTKGNNAYTKVMALEQALNLTNINTCTITKSSGITSIDSYTDIKCATNADKSLFKIYGHITVSLPPATPNQYVTITNTGLGTIDAPYQISCGTINYQSDGNIIDRAITVNTDGSITVPITIGGTGATTIRAMLPPILYFNKTFGDNPQPE